MLVHVGACLCVLVFFLSVRLCDMLSSLLISSHSLLPISDPYIIHPVVKMHVVNAETGRYLAKKEAMFNENEPAVL